MILSFCFYWGELCVIPLTYSKNILWDWILEWYKFVDLQFCRLGIWQSLMEQDSRFCFLFLEVLRGNRCPCPFHLLDFTISLGTWPPPFFFRIYNSGYSKFHCGWSDSTSRKRFLVNNTYKTWDKKIESQKIPGRDNCYDTLEQDSIGLGDWFNIVWRRRMNKIAI